MREVPSIVSRAQWCRRTGALSLGLVLSREMAMSIKAGIGSMRWWRASALDGGHGGPRANSNGKTAERPSLLTKSELNCHRTETAL